MNVKTYLHNCNAGDLICALAGIREIYRKYGKKAIIYQQLDIPGHYTSGLVHSVKDDKGVQVTMNRQMFDMLKPLLESQEYVEEFRIYSSTETIDVDLTVIRERLNVNDQRPEKPARIERAKQFVNIPNMALPGWLMLAWPPMACDISEPWITATIGQTNSLIDNCILINRTERYQVPKMDYSFLKSYEKELLFTGTEREHNLFCDEFNLDFPRLEINDFLELAGALLACRFFVGNQSFPWNLANAMGVPRILEMCSSAPNCQPFVGKDNYGALFNLPLQYFFEELYKKKAVAGQRL